jgi:pimeloyl-ACP methyl ester carboxylesterase
MAQQKTSKTKAATQPPQYRKYPAQPVGAPEVVDPVWLMKAIAVVIAAALVCGYASLCLLLYQGQWQLILHPKQTTSAPASIAGVPVETLRFGTDESGTPQLTGWMIPAVGGGRYAGVTVLYLPSGDGSLVDASQTLAMLHGLGVAVFAFDYRGYGQSVAVHPNQERMMQDADWAFAYLKGLRAVPESSIVPYGVGVGASLATHLAAAHAGIPAVVLDSPGPDPMATVLADPRTKFLPVRWLLHDRFPLAEPLATLKTPKLLILPGKDDQRLQSAPDPKITVFEVPQRSSATYQPMMMGWLSRFFDQYVGAKVQPLQPGAAGQ